MSNKPNQQQPLERLVMRIGVPHHFVPAGARTSACGIFEPKLSASIARDVDCVKCRRTKLFNAYA